MYLAFIRDLWHLTFVFYDKSGKTHQVRSLNFGEKGSGAIKVLHGIARHLDKSPGDKQLFELLSFRVSRINGCAFCLDMHSKELLAKWESAQRLFSLDAW